MSLAIQLKFSRTGLREQEYPVLVLLRLMTRSDLNQVETAYSVALAKS